MTIFARWARLLEHFPVDIPDDLIAPLAELTGALGEVGTDRQAMLAVLIDDLVTAVPSFLGLTMTIPQTGNDAAGVTLNFLPPELAEAVGTTLLVPLDALGVSGPGGTVVFYAARPGAFVDLAADTRVAYGLDGQVTLDQHLPSPDIPAVPSGMSGHTQTSTINQAIGVLLGRGHTPTEARRVLHHRADRDGVPLHHVAQQLLDTPGSV